MTAITIPDKTTGASLTAAEFNQILDGIKDGTRTINTEAITIAGAAFAASNVSDFDTEVANNSAVSANTAKVTNATHSGEVTGATALTIADNVVDEANLKLDTTPTNDYVLTADSTASGGMKWAAASAGFTDPMSTRGDIIIRDASNTTARLGVGTNGQVLASDGTDISWTTVAGSGDVSKVGTPIDNQVGVWTGDGTIEGTSGLTYDGSNLQLTGDIGATGTRITKAWLTDLEVTNAIAGNITGNAATSTTSVTATNAGTATLAETFVVTDESTDTTCFPLFVTTNTGNLSAKTAAGLTFNSSTDVLSGTFSGNITGDVTGNVSGSSGSCTGNAATATSAISAGTAAVATTVTVTDNESTAEENVITFVADAAGSGNVGLEADGNLTYNPSTGKVTATGFIGDLTGNADTVTGFTPASGSLTLSGADALTITTSAATSVTLPTSGTLLANVVEDTTPELGGELDCGAHSVGFTMQTATGDGTTTIDWRLGNKMKFTFGAASEVFTFTAPSNPCSLQLIMVQDATGGRTATWPGEVKWPSGTPITLTTTGTTGTDIVSFLYDGTNYYGAGTNDFS